MPTFYRTEKQIHFKQEDISHLEGVTLEKEDSDKAFLIFKDVSGEEITVHGIIEHDHFICGGKITFKPNKTVGPYIAGVSILKRRLNNVFGAQVETENRYFDEHEHMLPSFGIE